MPRPKKASARPRRPVGSPIIFRLAFLLDSPACFAFSRALQALRVVDFDKEVLVAGFKSWFGGILCLAWSPDGRYIVTGGEVKNG